MKRFGVAGMVLMLAAVVLYPLVVKAQYLQNGITYAPKRIVVALQSQYSTISPAVRNGDVVSGISDLDALNRQFSITSMSRLFPGADKVTEAQIAAFFVLVTRDSLDLEAVLESYAGLASVEHVEPVGIHRTTFTPNDPSLSSQWALTTIDARQAWDRGRGDSTVSLGIADTGVDWDHPDISANIWYNFADPVDGIDNDGNGYVDDIRGWDWVTGVSGFPGEDDNLPDNNPMDFDGHGTHVSGIASAATNNVIGVAGLGFNCSIMALRIGWKGTDGLGYVQMDFAASAIDYAWRKGAKAINCSWGSSNDGGIGTAVSVAVSHGVVIVSAAGNDGNQVAPYLCTRSDVIAVAATDQTDHKASWSNYGTWVDVCAPGVNIYSTIFNNTYAYLDGTSMAAPFVTGLTGLIRAAAPSLTRAQVQTRIISSADPIDGLNPGYAGLLGSGRINAATAMAGIGFNLTTPIPISPAGAFWINAPYPTFIWRDTSQATGYHVMVDQSSSFSSPDISDSTIVDTTLVSPDSLVDGNWYWRVRGGIDGFWSSWSATQLFRIDTRKPNTTTLLTPAQDSWTSNRRPTFSWSAVTDVGGSGISKYFIQLDNDSLFIGPLLLDDSTTSLNYALASDLPGDGRYFWRVRARDVAGNYGFYATSNFGIDTSPPSSPIAFNATPDGWTSNPNFTLAWTNPSEPSGISLALYKVGTAPGGNYDTTGHFSGTPPATYVTQNTGVWTIYLWLVDGAGNTSYLQRSQDSILFDITPPSGCVASSPDSSNRNISVTWTAGTDVGSGIAGIYDVRYKDGAAGVWTDWLTATNNLFGTFQNGVHNHTYFFEARGRDLAGNVEPFTGVAETQTIVDTTLAGPSYLPGDANASGNVNGLDVVYLVAYLKGGPPPPDPILRGDANGSCNVNGLDVTYLVSFLKGGPPPFLGDCKK